MDENIKNYQYDIKSTLAQVSNLKSIIYLINSDRVPMISYLKRVTVINITCDN